MVGSGVDFYATYGMTETCSHVALRKAGESKFEALPGFRFTTDQRGCLVIKSETMSFGHLEESEREIAPFVIGHDFFITSRPSDRWGEELVMIIEGDGLDTEALDRELSLNIDHKHKPKAYILKKSLQRTETGKLLRRLTK